MASYGMNVRFSNKMQMKSFNNKKTNYKKKNHTFDECCICYNRVEKSSDNTILCGKTPHTICGDCKIKMKDEQCPMCRSHPIKMPIAQNIYLKKIKKEKKSISIWSPEWPRKQKRNYERKNTYIEEFGLQSNRIRRQQKNAKGYSARSYILSKSEDYFYRSEGLIRVGRRMWVGDDIVIRYNGGMQTEYDTQTEASDDSEDTLSLISETTDEVTWEHIRELYEDSD